MSGTGTERGEATVVIAAPPERVWALVTDIARVGEWSPEAVAGEWLDGATVAAVGARFEGSNRRGKTRWSTTCEVVAADGREFAFATGSVAKPGTLWRYRLEPAEDGTRLTESFELVKHLGFGSRLVTRMTTGVRDRRSDLEDGVRTTLANLKRVAEADR